MRAQPANSPSALHRSRAGDTAGEPHGGGLAQRLNWLRAGVLGANDGIVSVAAVVVGVAGASGSSAAIVTAALAALVGGAISMALGEYVSVSSQRDSERALIGKERDELQAAPQAELAELAGLYRAKGLSAETAATVAAELSAHDALAAHLSVELGIDQNDVVSPWRAAFASAVAFTTGALLPMSTALLPVGARIPVTFAVVLAALAVTGYVAAWIGGSNRTRATIRLVVGGALALFATYGIGLVLDTAGIV